jgi:hypothetical protein
MSNAAAAAAAAHERHPCVPLYLKASALQEFATGTAIPLADWMDTKAAAYANKADLAVFVREYIKAKALVESSPHYSVEQKSEFVTGWENPHFRHQQASGKDGQKKAWMAVKLAAEEGFCPVHRMSKDPIVTLILCHTPYGTLQKGDIIVYFNASHRGPARLPKQLDDCVVVDPITELEARLAEREAHAADLEAQLAERESHTADLEAKLTEIRMILSP